MKISRLANSLKSVMTRSAGYCHSDVPSTFHFPRAGDSFRLMAALWRGFFRPLRGRSSLEERMSSADLPSVGEAGDGMVWVTSVGNTCTPTERTEDMRVSGIILHRWVVRVTMCQVHGDGLHHYPMNNAWFSLILLFDITWSFIKWNVHHWKNIKNKLETASFH